MNTDLAASIVRILRSDKETTGTGFVVAEGLIVTCAHVIPPAAQPKEGRSREDVAVVFRACGKSAHAVVVAEWWRPADGGDVAFLRLKEPLPAGVSPLPLGSSQGTGNHAFQTFGFPSASPEEGIWGDGHILAETLMQGMRVLQLSSQQITPGFSGAPVFDTVSRRVVGMVTAIASQDEHGRMAETAFITPVETLRMICPQLTLSDVQPYLGLAAFGETDAEFFFGRRREVERLLAGLGKEPRFLAVLGPSGSGKSSVVQAGLIPLLRRGGVPGSDRWGIITARPGDRPQENLQTRGLDGAVKGLAEAARGWLAKNPDKTRLVLVLDQFEELLATASPEKRQDFLGKLKELLDADLPITLLLIMRDDFFSRFAQEAPPSLFEWVQRGFVHISAGLEEEELKEIIEGPAGKVGLQFEEGLVESVVKDVLESTVRGERAGRSTILPLLESALTELWRRRKEGYLTHEAYSAIGGVTGSLTQWADQAYQSLGLEGLGEIARRVLTELVNLGDERQGIPDSRRRRTLEDFGTDPAEREAARKVVMRLADARLVTTSFDQQNKQETAEIIHDSLIREWGRLRRWLREDRSFLAWDREMEKKAAAWEEGKRDDGRLLRGLDLSEAESWREKRGQDLGEAEEKLIAASLALQEREKREKEQRRKRIILGMAAFSALALVLAGAAIWQWNLSEEKTEEALALYLATLSIQKEPASMSDLMRKTLFAVESLRHKETAQVDLALRENIFLLARPKFRLDHLSTVSAIAVSLDGRRIATGASGMTKIWDADSGALIKIFPQSGWIKAVALSHDGRKVVAGGTDGVVRIWDVESETVDYNLVNDGEVTSLEILPDRRRVAVANGKDVRIWDPITNQSMQLSQEDWVNSIALSPDGEKIAIACTDKKTRIWNLKTRKVIEDLSRDYMVNDIAFSPDGREIAAACNDGRARIWNWTTENIVKELVHGKSVNAIAFSPNGANILTGSEDNTARIWDAKTGLEINRMPHDNAITAVTFGSNGQIAAIADRGSTATIWDITNNRLIKILANNKSADALAFSPNSSMIAIASHDALKVWNMQKDTIQELQISGLARGLAFSSDGKKILTSNGFWELDSDFVKRIPYDEDINAVAIDQNGGKIAMGDVGGIVRIWNPQTYETEKSLLVNGTVNAMAFSPNGNKVAIGIGGKPMFLNGNIIGSYDMNWPKVIIWELDSNTTEELPSFDQINSVAFSTDGSKIASGGYDRTARIWDVNNNQLIQELPYGDFINTEAFSSDNRKLAIGGDGQSVQIWDVATGELIQELPQNKPTKAVVFSPDGSKVAMVGEDGLVIIWPVSTEDLIIEACKTIVTNLTAREWESILRESDCKTCPREGKFNRSSDSFMKIKIDLKRARRLLLPYSASEAKPGECQPCIAEAFRNVK